MKPYIELAGAREASFSDGNYGRAMAAVRRKKRYQRLQRLSGQIILLLMLLGLFLQPSVRYWTFEIFASLVLDALVYVLLPFFLIAVALAIAKHYRTILRALWECLRDAAQFMQINR